MWFFLQKLDSDYFILISKFLISDQKLLVSKGFSNDVK